MIINWRQIRPAWLNIYVWLIILAGMLLRVYRVDYYPLDHNDDGLAHAWAGISQLTHLTQPASLSLFTAYQNKALFWFSHYDYFIPSNQFELRLVQPYFDQPPLGTLLIGLPAYLMGYRLFDIIPPIIVRLPSLIASLYSLCLCYILAKRLFSPKIAALSLTVYSLVPYYIFAHKEAFLENLLTPVFLTALLSIHNYLIKPRKSTLCLLIFLCFISGWIKIIGFGLTLIVIFWLLTKARIKESVMIGLSGLVSLLSYILYGKLISWDQFVYTLTGQASRGFYVSSFIDILTRLNFYEIFRDGWYILGFLAIFSLFFQRQENPNIRFLLVNFVLWLILIMLTIGPNNNFSWYRNPLFPLLSLATGYMLHKTIDQPNLFFILPILLFGFTGIDILHLPISANILRLSFLFILFPYLWLLISQRPLVQKIGRFWAVLILIFAFSINIWTVLKYWTSQCSDRLCPMPGKIIIEIPENIDQIR